MESSITVTTDTPAALPKKSKHPLVTYISLEDLSKIDGIADALGLNRSDTARKLLDLAFKTLAAKIPEALGVIDEELLKLEALNRAKASLEARFSSKA